MMLGVGYRKGERFDLPLYPIENNGRTLWLSKAARESFLAMYDAADADGVRLVLNTAFRDNAFQERLWRTYQRRLRAWQETPIGERGPRPPPAARPGYSNHQSGIAVDISTQGQGVLSWLTANAQRFSFFRTVDSEPWHWEYLPERLKPQLVG